MKYEKLMRRYSITLLESHLKTILDHKKNHVHPGTMSYAIRYVSLATTIPHTMNKLKPFVDTLLYQAIVPIMMLNAQDIEVFEMDSAEYIRNYYDFSDTLFKPRNQIGDLLCALTEWDYV